VIDGLLRICGSSTPETTETIYIREYLTPAAAGYASPAMGEDYVLIPKDSNVPREADFAVKISGDSMEPYIADGSRVYVKRTNELDDGDVGVFFVNGDMKCKQYCEDNFGNIYLLSLNRERSDADTVVSASSGVTVFCFGKVLLQKRPPLPGV
jgi:phage repressor protein C with HTH and peptisase S24 domain